MTRSYRAVPNLLVILLIAACSAPKPLRLPDPRLVQAYTGGVVSRHAVIEVAFADRVQDVEVGAPLSPSPVSFSPRISGSARWADERTLEFLPSKPLAPGTKFRATVSLPRIPEFDFIFAVMKSRFDVTLGGLSSAPGESGEYSLDGTVRTTDTEDPKEVEKLVTASLRGGKLALLWTHSEDPLVHSFRITGITREQKPAVLDLQWSGKAIQSSSSGKKRIAVPAKTSFEVLDVRAVEDAGRFIEVGFSDPLGSQDLTGLIGVSGRSDVRLAVYGSRVRLYSPEPWRDSETVTIQGGVQNEQSAPLAKNVASTVSFQDQLPQVRFTGSGVIVPTSQGLTVPFETMNLRAVIVEAFQVFGDNMTQFLQVNALYESSEMYRVGKVVWRNLVQLDYTDDQRNKWIRHGLDLSQLLKNHPDGMFQLRLSFRPPQIVWKCDVPIQAEETDWTTLSLVQDDPNATEKSYWDYYDMAYNEEYYANRRDPCSPSYYFPWSENENVLAVRNVLVSDIGLIAKGEPGGSFYVVCTDLRTAQPLQGVRLSLLSLQRQTIASGTSDRDGMAKFPNTVGPAFVVAERGDQHGYLKVDNASALVTSHLDVGGDVVASGVKGFIYGERGVWRPGDPVYLTFILSDPLKTIPADHPVTLELRDPRGQVAARMTKTTSLDGFYSFSTQTDSDAPTGSWEARVKIGDLTFSKGISVESIMPNRLKMSFEIPAGPNGLSEGPFKAPLQASWLYGAPGANLKAEIKMRLSPAPTTFSKWSDYVFDDPSRSFEVTDQTLYEGTLDAQGKANVSGSISVEGRSPGKLKANFLVRVFEPGGTFSTEQFSQDLNPYSRYVGIRVPKGDATRGMLLVDTDQAVSILLVDPAGNPIKSGSVRAEIYKINWRWWWEQGDEDLAEFVNENSLRPIVSDRVSISNGLGQWKFQIHYPDWGRYLIRVSDLNGDHSAGKVMYIDWPGWAGRSTEGKIGVSMLTLAADKPKYAVGERVTATFPSNPNGRALVVLEKSGRVIREEWVNPSEGTTRYQFEATPAMTPNLYVHVTFLQPHMQTANDLPIRLYGVVPIQVEDPSTHLAPVVRSEDTFQPMTKARVTVSEAKGREMTYTLALVDEGLLTINRYLTPDPWGVFYRREASMLKGWDLYDLVAGAFAGKLENLLSIGGGEEGFETGERKPTRFTPVVRFIGPVALKTGAQNTHDIDIPQYVGAVRIMVVAGHGGAYGAAEKSVTVKSDLMVLPTLPRVLSPGEEVSLPVSVINTRDDIKSVTLTASASGPVSLAGVTRFTMAFSKPEEKLANFMLRVGNTAGTARIRVSAASGRASASQDMEIAVRMPVGRQTKVVSAQVQPGKTWQQDIALPGVSLSNSIQIEASRIPPLDLGKNLDYLIQYPHGCVEQTTSSVFPQLSLDKLVQLSPSKAAETQRNIEAGIKRLQYFQTSSGGFSFWPGMGASDEWATSYAGHFLLEAMARGFVVPKDMISHWSEYQSRAADSWEAGDARGDLIQAYRLYTLALCGSPSLGSMNRLKESPGLSNTTKWRLASAYQLAGQKEVAQSLVRGLRADVTKYREMEETYGSDLRDKAIILEAMLIMGNASQIQALAEDISRQLTAGDLYGTQSTAYALLALARYGAGTSGSPLGITYSWAGGAPKRVSTPFPMLVEALDPGAALGGKLSITNDGSVAIYPRIILTGVPAMGSETPSENGVRLSVGYEDANGRAIDPKSAPLGQELVVSLQVRNTSSRDYQQMALSYLLPGSWEVAAARVVQGSEEQDQKLFDYRDIRDDRVLTYFSLKKGESKEFSIRVVPTYGGKFYQPSVSVEAMYDPTISALIPGQWMRGN